MENRIKYNCIFGGGGIRGLCYIGALEAINELDITIDSVAGSSVGAVFAALYAVGYNAQEIKEMFIDFNFNMFRDLNFNLFNNNDISISKGEIFLDWLREKIGKKVLGDNYSLDSKVTFRNIKKDLHILTLDLNTNSPFIFSKKNTPDEEIALAVRASAGLPGLMTPMTYNQMLLVDGDLIKMWAANKVYSDLDMSENRLLEFRLEGSRDGSNIKNPMDYLSSIINTVWYLSTENVYADYAQNDKYDFVVIDAKDTILFDFTIDKQDREKLVDLGYQTTKIYFKNTLVKKKSRLYDLYCELDKQLETFENSIMKNDLNKSLYLISEIVSNFYLTSKYLEKGILDFIVLLKELLLKSVKKHLIFSSKLNNSKVFYDKLFFVRQLVKNRLEDISFYLNKNNNIS